MTDIKSRVALVPCASYEDDVVLEAVRRGLELLGGAARFVSPGETILLKPNVLIGSSPERCVCTHPAVFRAAATVLREASVNLTCGDSPAAGGARLHMRLSGLKQVADDLAIPIADFSAGHTVAHPEALLYHRFSIARGVLAADGLVSLPKLKSHALTRMTGAVKNQFGCVPGLTKGQQHARLPDPHDFATMLVDLNSLLKPRLCIMDAVMAMEGNGPRNGDPRHMGLLIISDDPVALDATACRLINLDPAFVPTMAPGERTGRWHWRAEDIEVLGASIEDYVIPDFRVVRRPPDPIVRGPLGIWFKNRVSPRPAIDGEKCTQCGVCIKHCPVEPKAVNWQKGQQQQPPAFDYARCIRCFCCQELCPEGAVTYQTPWLGKIFFR